MAAAVAELELWVGERGGGDLAGWLRQWRWVGVGAGARERRGLLTWGRESMWGHHLARCFCLAKVGQPAHEFGQPDGLAIRLASVLELFFVLEWPKFNLESLIERLLEMLLRWLAGGDRDMGARRRFRSVGRGGERGG